MIAKKNAQTIKPRRYIQQQPSDRFRDIDEELHEDEENIVEGGIELNLNEEEFTETQFILPKNLIQKEYDVDEFLETTNIKHEENDTLNQENTQQFSEWLKEIRMS